MANLVLPDEEQLKTSENALKQAAEAVSNIETAVQKLRADETALQVQISELREQQNQAQRALNQADAEIHSLQKLQQSVNAEGKLGDWLTSKGLKNNARLWQKIKIDETWSVALEAVLGAKLNALISDKSDIGARLDNRPPAALVLGYRAGDSNASSKQNAALTPLISVIKDCDTDLKPILADWLEGAWMLAPMAAGAH